MVLITQRDFQTKAGQERVVKTIHKLESRVHDLEQKIQILKQRDTFFERDLEGPEAY